MQIYWGIAIFSPTKHPSRPFCQENKVARNYHTLPKFVNFWTVVWHTHSYTKSSCERNIRASATPYTRGLWNKLLKDCLNQFFESVLWLYLLGCVEWSTRVFINVKPKDALQHLSWHCRSKHRKLRNVLLLFLGRSIPNNALVSHFSDVQLFTTYVNIWRVISWILVGLY